MMKKRLSLEKQTLPQRQEIKTRFLLLSLSFVIGALAGSYIGSFFNFDTALSDFIDFSALNSLSYFEVFFRFIRFHLAVILLGTSFLGIAFLPALSCIRGYALSCTAATIISSYPKNGIIMALIILGIPAVLSLPCFFVMSVDGFISSGRIINLLHGRASIRTDKFFIHALACLPFLALGTLLEMKLVPYLVSLLT
jgi:hypothetical protein